MESKKDLEKKLVIDSLKSNSENWNDHVYDTTLQLISRHVDHNYRGVISAYMSLHDITLRDTCHNMGVVRHYIENKKW